MAAPFRRSSDLEEAGGCMLGPELGNLRVERAELGIERPARVAVARGAAVARSPVAAGTDQAIDIGRHDDLQYALGDVAQEVAVAGPRRQPGKL